MCLGNFDGVHRGHQSVLLACKAAALQKNLRTMVFTFSPHPLKVLRPEVAPRLLLTHEEKTELLSVFEFDFLLFQEFDLEFSRISPEDFVNQVIKKSLGITDIFVGENFRFGRGAKGSADDFRKVGGLTLHLGGVEESGGEKISSSRIREFILNGEIERANQMLGYPYFISGRVVSGDGRGRELGFPTANIQSEKDCFPKNGVYISYVEDLATKKIFAGVTNIGSRPTFNGEGIRIETHLIHFKDELIGRSLRLYLMKYVRDEMKFDSVDDLKSQLVRDIQFTKEFFHSVNFLRTTDDAPPLSLNSDYSYPDPHLMKIFSF